MLTEQQVFKKEYVPLFIVATRLAEVNQILQKMQSVMFWELEEKTLTLYRFKYKVGNQTVARFDTENNTSKSLDKILKELNLNYGNNTEQKLIDYALSQE